MVVRALRSVDSTQALGAAGSDQAPSAKPAAGPLEDASLAGFRAPSLRGFQAFDAALLHSAAPVLEVVVQPEAHSATGSLTSESLLEAAAAHAARRLGDGVLLVVHDAGADIAAALRARLGLRGVGPSGVAPRGEVPGSDSPRDSSSRELGAEIARALSGERPRTLVVLERQPGRFSSSVLEALASSLAKTMPADGASPGSTPDAGAPRVVWVRPEAKVAARRPSEAAMVCVALNEMLSAREASAWWRAAASSFEGPNLALPGVPLTDAGHAPSERVSLPGSTPESCVATLPALERWFCSVRGLPLPARGASLSRLPAGARALHSVLAAAGRAWPFARLDELDTLVGSEAADASDARPPLSALLESLRVEGLALVTGDSVAALLVEHALPLDGPVASQLSRALEQCFPTDAWALLRAAELSLDADGVADARRSIHAAFRVRLEPEARGELLERSLRALSAFAQRASASDAARSTQLSELLLELSDLAQRHGELEQAAQLGRLLLSLAPHDARALLAVGRLDVARGDLATAELTLGRALSSDDPAIACAAKVELAELSYAAGEFTLARERAEGALAEIERRCGAASSLGSVRLAARNVLGKLLLAGAAFAEAEAHFVEDTLDAQLAGLPTAELRSRVNRAIAALSLGRRLDARAILEEVLADAERNDELRAMAMAITNLATIAILEHRHVDALQLGERAVEVLRRTGEKPRVVRAIANLAELRLWMGLVDEADDVIRFARQSLRSGLSAGHAAHLSLVASRVRLLRGDTVGARRFLSDTLASLGRRELLAPATSAECAPGARPTTSLDPSTAAASGGSVGKLCAEALRLGARIALADGEVDLASLLLERAAQQAGSPRGRAEQLLLEALTARSAGRCGSEHVAAALRVSAEVDDDELVRESLVLAYRVARDRGALDEARSHLRGACRVRDRIVEGLSPSLAQRYLARAESVELASLEVLEFDGPSVSVGAHPAAQLTESAVAARARTAVVESPADALRRGGAAARGIVGQDPAIRALLGAIRKVGAHDTTVLVHGESGTGKELVAEALHAASARASGPLVKVNCAALVETLLLSELFGHEKGSFTGAAGRRRGRFEAAEGGTLFLDEIGDISPATQVALLRVLQERSFERVGGTTTLRADVRVVCATHRNLKALVERGQFREDLYYRLCGVVLEVPPLRDRLGDLAELTDSLLRRIAAERGTELRRVSARALAALRQHTWPGNVRELENALRAASLFADGEELELEDFTDNVESLRQLGTDALLEAAPARGGQSDSCAPTAHGAGPRTLREGARVGPTLAGSPSVLSPASTNAHPRVPPSVAGGVGGVPSAISSFPAAPASVPDAAYASIRSGTSLHDIKRLIERECVARALTDAGGNITRAATLLGMKRPRLSQLVKQYGLAGSGDGDGGEAEASEGVSDAEED